MPARGHRRMVVLSLVGIFVSFSALAREVTMKHYTLNDGLPSGTIYSMLSDSKGFMWFATDAGVSRFDGHKFTNFTLTDGLSDNEPLKVAEDSKGRIWFLGFSGTLSYYYNGRFYNPSNDPTLRKAQLNHTYFFFFEDKDHRLWFSSDYGYTIIDENKVTAFSAAKDSMYAEGFVLNTSLGVGIVSPYVIHPDNRRAGLFISPDKKNIRFEMRYKKELRSRFCYLADGSVLFATNGGIALLKDTSERLVLPTPEELKDIKILGIFLSSDNLLWIQTMEKGLYCYSYKDLSLPPKRYMENIAIADVAEDNEHNIWIATFGEGVYMLPATYKAVTNFYSEKNERHSIYCVVKDKNGEIYTGHDDLTVNTLTEERKEKLFFRNQDKEFGYNRVNKLLINENNMWIGSDADITHITAYNSYNTIVDVKQLTVNISTQPVIRKIGGIKDIAWRNNDIVVCNNAAIFLPDTTQPKKDILLPLKGTTKRKYCVYADHRGTIWYGASDGLNSYDGASETNHAAESFYLNSRINDIAETSDSILVLASYGYGILFYKNGKLINHLTEKEGLSNNICKRVFVHNSEIYVATASGATLINYQNGEVGSIRIYSTADGIVSNNLNDIYADDSEICFATTEGLTILNKKLNKVVTDAPLVYITSIKCRDTKLVNDSNYIFSYRQNSIQFTYTGISYRMPDEVIYQYRLNENQKWMETKNTSIDIPYLDNGSYHFELRAKILNGPWSNTKSFHFTILPPFWKTWWFITVSALFFILAGIFISRYRVELQKRRQSEELKIKDQVAYLEQQALQAMMNPHFIFNVMNSIQHYINNNEKHEANVYLADFARLIRMNLDISSKRYIPLDEEVAYLELYMNLESLRFGKNLSYNIHVDPDIDGDETMVPVMLLQPFIENAIWHGILPKKESGHVQVEIKKENDGMLRITITDNGVGIPETKLPSEAGLKTHISRGMKMTRQRLDLLSKITGHTSYINIEDAFPGEQYKGTKVAFHIPGDLA